VWGRRGRVSNPPVPGSRDESAASPASPKSALVVCGPTASGKSELSDALAEVLTERSARHVPTLVVDSMQVYKELPIITNQARARPAEMVGIVSVTGEWSVAAHKARAQEIIAPEVAFVFDAGTGMYLNALLLDFPLAPKVSPELRRLAEGEASDVQNSRRAARQRELELAGAEARGSVWDGNLEYETSIVYLRPERADIDAAIAERSRRIARDGLGEAEALKDMLARGEKIGPSVMDSVGVRELTQCLSGDLTLDRAEDLIANRTRRLARRQMRWFDKLAKTLKGRARLTVLEDRRGVELHSMHDIIGA
jgi:tRNA dimethylallyltransferase